MKRKETRVNLGRAVTGLKTSQGHHLTKMVSLEEDQVQMVAVQDWKAFTRKMCSFVTEMVDQDGVQLAKSASLIGLTIVEKSIDVFIKWIISVPGESFHCTPFQLCSSQEYRT